MKQINFDATKEDAKIIEKIVNRAGNEFDAPFLQTHMDITATHLNGNPLRLADLLAADKFNFAHDVIGIANHLDRKTGKLRNCFVPRFSL